MLGKKEIGERQTEMPVRSFFVAHQFGAEESDDLRDAIQQAFKETEFKACYADVDLHEGHIMNKIKQAILTAQFGI